jgi:hypothetical protein
VPPTIDDGYGLGVGTSVGALTPALPISTEPNGIPGRVAPPGDREGIAVDDAPLLLALVPQVAAVAPPPGIVAPVPAPIAIPPPSKVVLEPDIPDDALPMAEHVVPVPVIPIVPVGGGLRPGDAISVAPMGIPAGEVGEFGVMPSGEVTPIPGVGLPIPPTWAKAELLPNSAASIAAINARRISISIVMTQRPGRRGHTEPVRRPRSIADPIARCLRDPADFVAGLLRMVECRILLKADLRN